MHAIHDFTAKLRQPSLLGHVERYVAWRRAVETARLAGRQEPAPPALAPISINLDLTTACNYRCTHCIDWDILNTADKHREQELRDALTVMAERGLRSVILIGGGEPTLFPRFADFVKEPSRPPGGESGERMALLERILDALPLGGGA